MKKRAGSLTIKGEKMTLTVALMRFFGKKEGQTLKEFADEVNLLTHKDKTEIAEMLSKELGEPIEVTK